jgi:hypothetical protein
MVDPIMQVLQKEGSVELYAGGSPLVTPRVAATRL